MSDLDAQPVPIEHGRLRSAIELAVDVARAERRSRAPGSIPEAVVRSLGRTRIPAGALGSLRRAIEADAEFRRRVAAAADADGAAVDEIGREWLRGESGWDDRVRRLIEADRERAEAEDAAAALRRSERRRAAAEQRADRAATELTDLRRRLDLAVGQLADARSGAESSSGDLDALRAELAEARTAARHAEDRARAARQRVADLTDEVTAMRAERDEATAQRDALLAERAERAGMDVAASDLDELRRVAERARRVADQLAAVVATPASGARRPLSLPGGVARDSSRATELLLRAGGLVLVDGYNVSIATWPDHTLDEQRRRLLDLCDGVARRFGSDLAVIFDGADVVGAHHAGPRRLVRVRYSPAGVTADDVIRSELAAVPVARPVVVVSDDGEVRRDAAAAGANLIAVAPFVTTART